MSIQGLGTPSTSSLSYIDPTTLSSSTTSTLPVDDTDSDASQVTVSSPAQLLSKLQNLEASDPSKAQDVLHALADKVREQAQGASGDGATHLKAFADKLDKAADSGDLSGLSPAKHGGHGHHHHGGGSGAGVTPAADTSGADANSATSAYAKQQELGNEQQDAMKSLFDTLSATFDSLTVGA